MKKFLALSFLLVVALITSGHAESKQATCFADIAQDFANADQDTLVIFNFFDEESRSTCLALRLLCQVNLYRLFGVIAC